MVRHCSSCVGIREFRLLQVSLRTSVLPSLLLTCPMPTSMVRFGHPKASGTLLLVTWSRRCICLPNLQLCEFVARPLRCFSVYAFFGFFGGLVWASFATLLEFFSGCAITNIGRL